MDHSEAIRLKAVEGYLLDDLSDELREEFEEHYFGCQECAIDVQVGTAFVEGSKVLLSNPPASQAAPAPQPKPWLGWLRPAFTVPVMALLLLAVVYQTIAFKTHSSTQLASNAGQVSAFYLPAGVSRGDSETAAAQADSPFTLRFDIPWDRQFSSYVYELHSPSGELQWSVTVPAEAAKNTVSVSAYLIHPTSGNYTLQGRGISSAGQAETRFDSQSFKVEIQ